MNEQDTYQSLLNEHIGLLRFIAVMYPAWVSSDEVVAFLKLNGYTKKQATDVVKLLELQKNVVLDKRRYRLSEKLQHDISFELQQTLELYPTLAQAFSVFISTSGCAIQPLVYLEVFHSLIKTSEPYMQQREAELSQWYLLLAKQAYTCGNYQDALTWSLTSLRLAASAKETIIVQAHTAASRYFAALCNIPQAIIHAQKALEWCNTKKIKDHHTNAQAYTALARAYRFNAQITESQQALQSAFFHYSEIGRAKPVDMLLTIEEAIIQYRYETNLEQMHHYVEWSKTFRLEHFHAGHPDAVRGSYYSGLYNIMIGDYVTANNDLAYGVNMFESSFGRQNPQLALFYNLYAIAQFYVGASDSAKHYHREAIDILEKTLGDNHLDTALIYQSFAVTCMKLGNFGIADEYQQKSFDVFMKILPPHHPDMASAYSAMGLLRSTDEDTEKAIEYCRKAVDIQTLIYGEKHIETAGYYNNLGLAYQEARQMEEALTCFNKTFEIYQQMLPPNHPYFAMIYTNISFLNQELGNTQIATEYALKALELSENIFEKNHPNLSFIYRNLASNYIDGNDIDKALYYQLKAIEIQEQSQSLNHPELGDSYANLGIVYHLKENLDDALKYQLKALDIFLHTQEGDHPSMAFIYNSIAMIYRDKQEFEKALSYIKKAIDIQERQQDTGVSQLVSIYNNAGDTYRRMGELETSLKYAMKALKKAIETGVPEDELLGLYNNVSLTFADTGSYKKSLKYARKAISVIRTHKVEDVFTRIGAYHNMATALSSLGKRKRAIRYYTKLIKLQELATDLPATDIGITCSSLAEQYMHLRKLKQAKVYLLRGIKILEKAQPEKDDDSFDDLLAGMYNNLGIIYREHDNLKKALHCSQKSLELSAKLNEMSPFDLANYNFNAALTLMMLKNKDSAIEFANNSLKLVSEFLDAKHPEIARGYNNIAGIYAYFDDHENSLKYHQKAAQIYRLHDSYKAELISTYNNIGYLLRDNNRLKESAEHLQQAIQLNASLQKPVYLDMVNSYNSLSITNIKLNDFPSALTSARTAANLADRHIPDDHLLKAFAFRTLASIYADLGYFPKALYYFEKALFIHKKLYSSDDADLAESYYQTSLAHFRVKNLNEAQVYIDLASQIYLKHLPQGHPQLRVVSELYQQIREALEKTNRKPDSD